MADEDLLKLTTDTLTPLSNFPCVTNQNDSANCTGIQEAPTMDGSTIFYYYLWTIITPIIFSLIIFIGTTGNTMVIYVILARPKMRTTTNILLLNLAIADIAFLVTCVPFQADKYASFQWKHSQWVCQLVQYSLYITAYVTVWTLTAIASMRYFTVVWSSHTARYRTKQNITCLCFLIWITIMLINIPTLLAHRVNVTNLYSYCGIVPDKTMAVLLSFFICAYVVPLLIICLLYLLIIRHLHRNRSTMINTSSKRQSRATRACKTIVIVVIMFCISWLPSHINSLIGLFGTFPDSMYYEIFRIIANSMAYGNSLANPFIYNYASEEFRNAFHEIFSSKCCRNRDNCSHAGMSFKTVSYKITEVNRNEDESESDGEENHRNINHNGKGNHLSENHKYQKVKTCDSENNKMECYRMENLSLGGDKEDIKDEIGDDKNQVLEQHDDGNKVKIDKNDINIIESETWNQKT